MGVKEKDINLTIGKKLAALLKKNNISVLMTRAEDQTIPLEQRIMRLSQTTRPDLLISIHANSATSDKACGIETFCLEPSLFKITGSIKDTRCRCILNKFRHMQYKKSKRLAGLVQAITVASAKKINPSVVNRGVKHSVVRMLLGIDFPGALIEVGFLTNKKELNFLRSDAYQSLVAQGICRAIVSFFKSG